MTQKELLYIEDAIGHENNIEKILELSIKEIDDDEIISFLEKELKEHQMIKDKLIKCLEEEADV